MKRRTKLYILVGWLLLNVIVIANIPASLVVKGIASAIPGFDSAVSQVNGTIWNGNLSTGTVELPSKISWKVRFSKIFHGDFSYLINYSNRDSMLNGDVGVHTFGLSVENLSGYVDSSAANHFLKVLNIKINHAIFLKDVRMLIRKQGGIADVSGLLTWPGGMTTAIIGSQETSFYMPSMELQMSSSPDLILLKLVDAVQKKEAARAEIKNGSTVEIQGRRHLSTLVNPAQENGNEDDIIFRMSLKMGAENAYQNNY